MQQGQHCTCCSSNPYKMLSQLRWCSLFLLHLSVAKWRQLLHLASTLVPICLYCLNCTKFGQLILRKISEIFCHQMSYFKAKMHQIQFWLGLYPRPHWGSPWCSPDAQARFKGALQIGKERGRKGGEMERHGGEREVEGRKRKGRDNCCHPKHTQLSPPMVVFFLEYF